MTCTGNEMQRRNDALVVIPAYNEAATIGEIIRRTLPYADVCVVNDASRDNTESIVKSFENVACLTHAQNTHIPQTLKDGMRYGVSQGYRYIVTMDAGLTHKPEELPRFLQCSDCDLVLGVRTERQNVPLFRKIISRTANAVAKSVVGFQLDDCTNGFRCYSSSFLREAIGSLHSETYEIQIETIKQALSRGFDIKEVPITFVNRKRGKSKLTLVEVESYISYILKTAAYGRNR